MSEVEAVDKEDQLEDQTIEASIAAFEAKLTPDQRQAIERRIRQLRNYSPRIGVFGKTGAGKSSLCNALFGSNESAVSHGASCTRTLKELAVGEEENKLILVDAPGISEDGTHDDYVKLYREQLPKLDMVLWVIEVRDRALADDLEFYRTFIENQENMPPFVIALNQVDAAQPLDWDQKHRTPSAAQRVVIDEKRHFIAKNFGLDLTRVVPVSAEKGYGLIPLVNRIVDRLPKEKRLPFVEKVVPEQVAPETLAEAKKDFFEATLDVVKKVLDVVKEHKETIIWIVSGVAALIKRSKQS